MNVVLLGVYELQTATAAERCVEADTGTHAAV